MKKFMGVILLSLMAIAMGAIAVSSLSPAAARPQKGLFNVTGNLLSDPEVIGVLEAANSGEVKFAQSALPLLNSSEAKRYAQRLIDDHNKTLASVRKLGIDLNITSTSSNMTEKMAQDITKALTTLTSAPSSQVDNTFLKLALNDHLNNIRDNVEILQPSSMNSKLKDEVENELSMVIRHMREATRLLSPGAANKI